MCIEVIPGLTPANRPDGLQASTTFRSVTGWTRDGNVETDYGAVILPDATLGNRVGWFGFTVLTDAQLEGLTMNTAGYPGDKPSGTEWFISGPLASASPRRLDYMIDTAPRPERQRRLEVSEQPAACDWHPQLWGGVPTMPLVLPRRFSTT